MEIPLVTNKFALNINNGTSKFGGLVLYGVQTLTFGDNGGTITATSGNGTSSPPTQSIVYLNSSSSTNQTYIWDLRVATYTPREGQLLNLFYNEVAHADLKLQINFGTDGLVSGDGTNDTLTFSSIGQSATLIYVQSKWRIINAGGTIA